MQWEPVPAYEVPPDFDKAALGAVDLSTKEKARRSLPLAFKRRWLYLRSKVTIPLTPCTGHTMPALACCCDCSPKPEVAGTVDLELNSV